ARIRNRGPDEGSTDAFGACGLGNQRLRVFDPELGYQPVANETGDVVAVFNGELYNFPELREELAARGHEVRGRGDTPTIPHLYEEHGPRFVERLEGMFAIALWDAPRGGRVLARDRLGRAHRGRAAGARVRACRGWFRAARYDERPSGRAAAEPSATRHEEVVLEPDAAANLPRLAAAFDEPLGDEAALPLYLICEAARSQVTVALVGDGGDESFAGYERYAAMRVADRVPALVAAAGGRLLRALPGGHGERRSTMFRAARLLEAAST